LQAAHHLGRSPCFAASRGRLFRMLAICLPTLALRKLCWDKFRDSDASAAPARHQP